MQFIITLDYDFWKLYVLQGRDHGFDPAVQDVAVEVETHKIHVDGPDQLALLDHEILEI